MAEAVKIKEYYFYVPRWLIGQMKIIGYGLLVIIFTLLIMVIAFKRIIKQNWSVYKCHPAVTPFSNFFGYKVDQIYTECLAEKVKGSSEEVLQSYNEAIENQNENSKNMMNSISGVREVMNIFKENFKKSLKNLMTKFQNIGATVQFLILKIQAIFQKILALYITLLYFAWSMLKGLESIVRDPKVLKSQDLIEKATNVVSNPPKIKNPFKKSNKKIKKAFCFDGESEILMDNGSLKKIKDVKIGDKLFNNIEVYSTLIVNQSNTTTYEIDGVYVTEDHLCFYNNKWLRVIDFILENKIIPNTKKTDVVYCLVTSNNMIPSKNHIFRDYEESNNKIFQSIISKMILNYLGQPNQKIMQHYETGETSNCLHYSTLINLKDSTKSIKEIQIGDILKDGNIVQGLFKTKTNNNKWFEHQGCHLGNNILIKQSNSWKKIYNIEFNKRDSEFNDLGYHLITSKDTFELKNGIQIRSFMETNNSKLHERISQFTLDFLNKKI